MTKQHLIGTWTIHGYEFPVQTEDGGTFIASIRPTVTYKRGRITPHIYPHREDLEKYAEIMAKSLLKKEE